MGFIKWLDKKFELAILAVLLAVMSVLSFSNVIMRYCLNSPLNWSDEVCCYCLALSAFFALPCAIRMRSSIRVDTFLVLLPKALQKVLVIGTNILMIAFLWYLLQGADGLIANAAKVNQASPALQIPLTKIYGVVKFAIGLSILRSVEVVILDLIGKGDA